MQTPKFFLLLVIGSIAMSAFAVSACDFFAGEQDEVERQILQRIEERREQWRDQGIEDYQMVYSQQVAETIVDSVYVRVRNGAVDTIFASPVEVPTDELLVGTVESFFDLILERVGEEESEFTADFNRELGFPTRYTADFLDGRASQTVIVDSLGETSAP